VAVEKVGQDETQKRTATCRNCGAVLRFDRKDVKTQHLSDMAEPAGSYDYVECVQCRRQVEVRK
jgi:ribosomal protein S27E